MDPPLEASLGIAIQSPSKKRCQKGIPKRSKRTQTQVSRKVARNVVLTHYLLRFGHIEQSRSHLLSLSLGCTISVKKASPEKHPSTHTLGSSDGHLEVPNVVFVCQLGSPLGSQLGPLIGSLLGSTERFNKLGSTN